MIDLGILFLLSKGQLRIGIFLIDSHFIVLGSVLSILGFQILNLGFSAKSYVLIDATTGIEMVMKSAFKSWLMNQAP